MIGRRERLDKWFRAHCNLFEKYSPSTMTATLEGVRRYVGILPDDVCSMRGCVFRGVTILEPIPIHIVQQLYYPALVCAYPEERENWQQK